MQKEEERGREEKKKVERWGDGEERDVPEWVKGTACGQLRPQCMGSDGEEESHDSMSPSTVQLLMSSTFLKEKKIKWSIPDCPISSGSCLSHCLDR